METLLRQKELEYLQEKRDKLYEETAEHAVEIDMITERIHEILNEQRSGGRQC